MIKMDYFKGDLLESGALGIAHQVNCQGVMGSGVAAQIRKKWPTVYADYSRLYESEEYIYLGKVQHVLVYENDDLTVCVFNIFAQDKYGRDGRRYTSYDALYDGLEETFLRFDLLAGGRADRAVLAIPRLGCGLGGGSWKVVEAIIYDLIYAHPEYDFDLHVYDLP